MKKFCTNCGAELKEDSVFCEECGARVEDDSEIKAKAPARVPERKETGRQGSAQKSGGGFPKAGLLILAVLILVVLFFFLFRGKGKGDPFIENPVSAETEARTESAPAETEADTIPDGYYVGPDGAYDPDADYGIADIDTEDGGNAAPAGGSEIAARLSTEDIAYATDFEWFLDCVLYDGDEAGRVITDPEYAGKITDDALSLNGGWKAYMCSDGKVYGSDVERYFNVAIDTDGEQFIMTANWKYMYDPAAGNSIDETHTDTFEGKYQNGTATARSTYAEVEFDGFYLSADGKTEYATGTFWWISGEKDRIGLMRSAR